jgi:hypothetical protein
VEQAAYFERVGESAFRATTHVSGAWRTEEQHIAPALGLLAHVVEADRDARRGDGLAICRLSYDILGTIPVDVVDACVTILRPGRTIELVEARLGHAGRDAVVLRAWLMEPRDTAELAGTPLASIAAPEEMPLWDPSHRWPGGFIESVEVRRVKVEPGRASFWVRSPLPLVAGEPVSRLARAVGLFDIANGMAVRVDPRQVAFPNLDLTAHLFREPEGDWVGFDTTVTFGTRGVGLTRSVMHDYHGPIGSIAQFLTVRPS